MDAITDPKQAGERLLQFARENRLAQGTWSRKEDGREFACLLGAAAGIDDAKECPASLMPEWLAHALPSLFDGQTPAHAMTFARRWGEAMIRPEWVRIDWYAVRSEWLTYVVAQASEAAQRAASAAAANYAAVYPAAYAAASYAASCVARAAADAADAADSAEDFYFYNRARATARDAQADALMGAIERAMEVARG